MNGVTLRVAIIEPDAAADPLQLPLTREAGVAFRDDLTPDGVERLVATGVDVIVLDLRHTAIPQSRPAVRLLRLLVRALRVVAVIDVDDDTAEQAAATCGAGVFRGWGQTPVGLLRAVLASRTVAPPVAAAGASACCTRPAEAHADAAGRCAPPRAGIGAALSLRERYALRARRRPIQSQG